MSGQILNLDTDRPRFNIFAGKIRFGRLPLVCNPACHFHPGLAVNSPVPLTIQTGGNDVEAKT